MISRIKIKNFKCLRDISLRIGKVTVFIGPNSSGKSSVIQALMVLKQSLNSPDVLLNGKYISLGDFDDILNVGSSEPEIAIGMGGEGVLKSGRDYEFYYEVTFDSKGKIRHYGELKTQTILKSLWGSWDRLGTSFGEIKPTEVRFENYHVSFARGDRIGHPMRVSGGGRTDEATRQYEELISLCEEVTSVIADGLNNIFAVPGIRGIDKPMTVLLNNGVVDFITSQGPSEQASNLASTLGYSPEIADKISVWTEKLSGRKVRQRLAPNKQTSVETLNPKHNTNIVNEGMGLNQIIFPFSQLAVAPSGSLVAIEEPEIHLHPKAQSDLMDILVEICKEENKCILLTTHSEHILFRLLTKVAKEELTPQDLAIYYFTKEDTYAIARELEIDEKGRLKGGLPGFFEEELKEFKEYLDALTQKG